MTNVICFIFQRHGAELNKLLNEMESQKELLHTYELTLEHKDSIVSNITNAIQKQVCSSSAKCYFGVQI